MKPVCIVVCGEPGTGKSTLAQQLVREGVVEVWLESDHWMVDDQGKYAFDPKRLSYVHEQCRKHALEACKKGISFCISNTNIQKWEAKPYIDMAKEHNYEIRIIHMKENFGSIHGVPIETIQKMTAKREFFTLEDFDVPNR